MYGNSLYYIGRFSVDLKLFLKTNFLKAVGGFKNSLLLPQTIARCLPCARRMTSDFCAFSFTPPIGAGSCGKSAFVGLGECKAQRR